MALMASPWRLSPEQIQIPVLLWQGELDRNAPPVMARHLATLIPHCTTHWFPGDGHLSIVTNHGQAILAGLHPPETPATGRSNLAISYSLIGRIGRAPGQARSG
jgi:fermentation-respiration switch protein FrsA (DUF1100 family)